MAENGGGDAAGSPTEATVNRRHRFKPLALHDGILPLCSQIMKTCNTLLSAQLGLNEDACLRVDPVTHLKLHPRSDERQFFWRVFDSIYRDVSLWDDVTKYVVFYTASPLTLPNIAGVEDAESVKQCKAVGNLALVHLDAACSEECRCCASSCKTLAANVYATLHEIGHVLNMLHVASPGGPNLMYYGDQACVEAVDQSLQGAQVDWLTSAQKTMLRHHTWLTMRHDVGLFFKQPRSGTFHATHDFVYIEVRCKVCRMMRVAFDFSGSRIAVWSFPYADMEAQCCNTPKVIFMMDTHSNQYELTLERNRQ